ncbi:MAG: DUF5777 family beta-barrel protein [Bacteroidota bacterium]|nr:DUF5777 family beta-barrel protein [Bacteroidota bacterium]
MKKLFLTLLYVILSPHLFPQNLMDLLNDSIPENSPVKLTFKTTRIVIGQSIENVPKKNILFSVGHHFGKINSGPSEFFGLTFSTVRIAFDYGLTSRLTTGVGISTYQKNLEGSVKYLLLRQTTGKKETPISLSYFGVIYVTTIKWSDSLTAHQFVPKLSYCNQLLLARKFNRLFSFQLTGTYIHYNYVQKVNDQNNIFAIGAGESFKITPHASFNLEYHYLLPGQVANDFSNSLSLGLDMDVGGHDFQLFITNSLPLIDRGFIAETQGKWGKGDIYFGFNIFRYF